MSDSMDIVLQAEVDVDATAKQINIQLGQLENKIKKLGIDVDTDGIFKSFNTSFNKVKDSITQISKSFGNINTSGKFSQGFNELNTRLKEIKDNVEDISKVDLSTSISAEGNERIEKALLTYKNEMGQIVQETMEWKNTFDEVGNINGQEFRSSLGHVSDDMDKAKKQAEQFAENVKQAKIQMQDLSKNFNITSQKDLFKFDGNIDESSLTNLTESINKLKTKYSDLGKIDIIDNEQLKQVKNEMSAISKEYDYIINNAELDKKINDYIIQQKKEQNNQANYIEKKQREIYLLEEKITNLGTVKGLDTSAYTANLNNLKTQLSTFGQGNSSIEQQKKSIESLIVSTNTLANTETKQLNIKKQQNDLYSKIEASQIKLNSISNEYDGVDTAKLKIASDAFGTLRVDIEKQNISVDEAKVKYKELANSMADLTNGAKKTSSATATLGDRLKKAFQYFTFYDALQLGKRSVQEMVSVIFDLDNALVDLQKVSTLSGSSLKNFTAQAYQLGSQISKSGSDVIKASTSFAKAGYGQEQLLGLSEAALKLTSIGDDLTNTTESAETLISVLRGFGKNTSEVTSIMDSINNVSNNAAVNFSDITMALQRMSGVMASSNVTMEQSIGMFTSVNEILRNTEMTSSGLNSISMRLRGLEEDGSAIDGLVPKLKDMYKTIAGIDMTDASGQVKSLFEVTKELAPVWDTLTINQKNYIAQQSAGLRQSKIFLTMMSNYDRVLETTALAYNSAGSAEKEFLKWQNSIEGRMNNLKSALEQFSTKTINSDFVKSIISATTSIVNFGTEIGGAIPVVLSLTSAFLIFKSTVVGNFLTGLITQYNILTASTIGAVEATTALSLAEKTLIAGAIIAGIMGIAYGINYITGASDRAKESINTLSGELKDIQDKTKSISNLGSTYIELSGNKNKTPEQLEEYLNTQNQLKELLPTLSGFYDEQGNFIIENVNALQDLLSVQKEYIQAKKDELSISVKDNIKYSIEAYEKEQQKLEDLIKLTKLYKKAKDESLTEDDRFEIRQIQEAYNIPFDKLDSEIVKVKDSVNASLSDMSNDFLSVITSTQNWANLTEEEANAVRKAYAELDNNTKQDYAKQIEDNTFNTQEFINTLSEYPSAIKYMETATKDATVANNELASSFLSIEDGLKKLTSISSDAEKINTILESLNKGDEISANDMETLLGISDEYLIYLGDEVKLREKLTQNMSDYASSYEATYNQMLGTSTEYYQTKIKDDVDTRNKLESNISDYFKTLNLKYNEDLKEYTDFENAKGKVTLDVVKQIAGVWSKYFDASGNLINDSMTSELTDKKLSPFISDSVLEQANEKATSELQAMQGKIWQAQAGYDALVKEIAYVPTSMDFDKNESGVGSSDKTDKWKEDFEKQYKEIQYLEEKRIISTQQYYDKLDSLNNKYFANQTKYLDEYRQYDLELYNLEKEFADKRIKDKEFEISLLDFNGGEDSTSKQIEIYKQMQSEVHSLAEKARKLGISENDEYIQNLKTQWIGYSNDIGDLITSSYEKQNQAIEDSLKLLDVEQSKYKITDANYKNITDQKYNLILQQEELLKKKVAELYKAGLKKEAEELEKTFVDLYQKRIELVKEYQSIETDNLQSQIDILEKQKTALESLHDMTMQMIKDELNARRKQYEDEIKDITKVFNAKKKSITDAEDLRSYNKDLSEKTTVVADLENQLAIIKNDTTAIAKRKQLEDELVKAKEELDEYQRDHSVELQEDALDKQLELETDKLQDEIDAIDDTLSNEVKLRELADKRIAKSGEKLKNQLIANAKEYGSFTVEEVSNAWDTAGEAVDSFNDKQKGLLGTLKEISQELIDTQKRLKEVEKLSTDDYASSIGKPTTSTNKESAITKMQSNSEAWNKANAQEKKRLSEENQKLGKALGLIYDSSTGAWFYDETKKRRVYHEGGIVGSASYATKSTKELAAILEQGEIVLNSSQTSKIMGMVANNSTNNNSEAFSPTFMFNFEGQPNETLLGQFKEHGKELAKMVFSEMEKSDARMGIKRRFKTI